MEVSKEEYVISHTVDGHFVLCSADLYSVKRTANTILALGFLNS